MADIGKISINGKLIYPATVSDAVYDPESKDFLSNILKKQEEKIDTKTDELRTLVEEQELNWLGEE